LIDENYDYENSEEATVFYQMCKDMT